MELSRLVPSVNDGSSLSASFDHGGYETPEDEIKQSLPYSNRAFNSMKEHARYTALPLDLQADLQANLKPASPLDRFLFFLSQSWYYDILAELVAICAFIGLAALLKRYDGAPTTSWTSRLFTINGVVALLATIIRATLMLPVSHAISQSKWRWFRQASQSTRPQAFEDLKAFDDASRGVIGSLFIVWRVGLLYAQPPLYSRNLLLIVLVLAVTLFILLR